MQGLDSYPQALSTCQPNVTLCYSIQYLSQKEVCLYFVSIFGWGDGQASNSDLHAIGCLHDGIQVQFNMDAYHSTLKCTILYGP